MLKDCFRIVNDLKLAFYLKFWVPKYWFGSILTLQIDYVKGWILEAYWLICLTTYRPKSVCLLSFMKFIHSILITPNSILKTHTNPSTHQHINISTHKLINISTFKLINQMNHAISWFEIPSTDLDRATRFYKTIFQ